MYDPCWPDQVANANDSFVDLTPVSQVPAQQVRARWAAVLGGQSVPLIWETSYGSQETC